MYSNSLHLGRNLVGQKRRILLHLMIQLWLKIETIIKRDAYDNFWTLIKFDLCTLILLLLECVKFYKTFPVLTQLFLMSHILIDIRDSLIKTDVYGMRAHHKPTHTKIDDVKEKVSTVFMSNVLKSRIES